MTNTGDCTIKNRFPLHFLGSKLSLCCCLWALCWVYCSLVSQEYMLGPAWLPRGCLRSRACWFSFPLQKSKAVTITMEAAAIPVLKWKTHTNANVREDLFCQKTTTLAKVGQQNPWQPLPPEAKSMSGGTFLLVCVVFSQSVLSRFG